MKGPVYVHLLNTKGLCQQETTGDEYIMEKEEEEESSSENAEASLWMSCSPGRDLTDDEVDEYCEKDSIRDMDEMTEERGSADEEGKCSDDGDDDGDDGLLLSEVPVSMNCNNFLYELLLKNHSETKGDTKW